MAKVPELKLFYTAIKADNRIGMSHVSLYVALFELYNEAYFVNPVLVNRIELMELAKMSGLATYHKCIKDLHAFGYITYVPSFVAKVGSKVWIVDLSIRM